MRYVKGRIFRDLTLPQLSPDERREIYNSMNETLVALHRLDPARIGLGDYGKTTPDYLQR
jgi:aminoglycoside phosphotransferase (APT) family kinase protein